MTELSAHKQTSAKIRELFNDGKTKHEIKLELGVTGRRVNSALDYMLRKEKAATQPRTEPASAPVVPYAERDAQMLEFYNSLNTKGAMSMFHKNFSQSTKGAA
ncbi:MAG: hypothetical protein WC236_15120 [Gallionellaceae bacterium]|jgi:hypothetical protein